MDVTRELWLRELIECPVCFDIPLPPIRMCVQGHIVCNSCREQTHGGCPLCRYPYSETRNLLAEGIVARYKFPCKNADLGCEVTVKPGELQRHLLLSCDYRDVKCLGCNNRYVEYMDYENHLDRHHRLKRLSNEDNGVMGIYNMKIMKLQKCVWPQYYWKAFDRVFFVRMNYLADKWGRVSSINLWVALFGQKSELKNYTAFIEMSSPKRDHVSGLVPSHNGYKWERECIVNDFRDGVTEVVNNDGALTIPVMDIVLKSGLVFSTKPRKYDWTFKIVVHKKGSPTIMIPSEASVSFPALSSPRINNDRSRYLQLLTNAENLKTQHPTTFTTSTSTSSTTTTSGQEEFPTPRGEEDSTTDTPMTTTPDFYTLTSALPGPDPPTSFRVCTYRPQ